MKDLGEIGHLTKFDAFRMNRDKVMNIETWFTTSSPGRFSLQSGRGWKETRPYLMLRQCPLKFPVLKTQIPFSQ